MLTWKGISQRVQWIGFLHKLAYPLTYVGHMAYRCDPSDRTDRPYGLFDR